MKNPKSNRPSDLSLVNPNPFKCQVILGIRGLKHRLLLAINSARRCIIVLALPPRSSSHRVASRRPSNLENLFLEISVGVLVAGLFGRLRHVCDLAGRVDRFASSCVRRQRWARRSAAPIAANMARPSADRRCQFERGLFRKSRRSAKFFLDTRDGLSLHGSGQPPNFTIPES